MMRSLFAGVSGMKNHQTRMDVIGNNIANVNTVAFKGSRVTFKEGFTQMLQSGTRPTADRGGVNAVQVGLGMQVGSVDQLFTQGNVEGTGVGTDLAIQGDALFVVRNGNEQFYTRAGNFQLDGMGRLVSPTNGYVVQGRMAHEGILSDSVGDINIPFGQRSAAKATSSVVLGGNLNGSAEIFDTTTTGAFDETTRAEAANKNSYTSSSIEVYDSLGNKHDLKIWYYKTGEDTWAWELDPSGLQNIDADDSGTNDIGSEVMIAGSNEFTFNPDGTIDLSSFTPPTITFTPAGAEEVVITMDPGAGMDGLTQFAAASSASARDQNGYAAGELTEFTIDRTGTIVGAFSNGSTLTLGQIALADFNSPSNLTRVGDNMYAESANSGSAQIGYSQEGSASVITAGALEMSNVDLAQEFTNMIITQRGFQANGRVVTNADEMLQEVVNLKR